MAHSDRRTNRDVRTIKGQREFRTRVEDRRIIQRISRWCPERDDQLVRSRIQGVHIGGISRVRGTERPDQFGRRVHDVKALRHRLDAWRIIARPATGVEFNRICPCRKRIAREEEADDVIANDHTGIVHRRRAKGLQRDDGVVLIANGERCHVFVHNGTQIIQRQVSTDLGDKADIDPRTGHHSRCSCFGRFFIHNGTIQHRAGLLVQVAPALIHVSIADVAGRRANHPETVGRAAKVNRGQRIIQNNAAAIRKDQLRCQIKNTGRIKNNTTCSGRSSIQRDVDISGIVNCRLTQFSTRTRPCQFLCRAGGAVLNDRNRNIIAKQGLEAEAQAALDGDEINLVRDLGKEQDRRLARRDLA